MARLTATNDSRGLVKPSALSMNTVLTSSKPVAAKSTAHPVCVLMGPPPRRRMIDDGAARLSAAAVLAGAGRCIDGAQAPGCADKHASSSSMRDLAIDGGDDAKQTWTRVPK